MSKLRISIPPDGQGIDPMPNDEDVEAYIDFTKRIVTTICAVGTNGDLKLTRKMVRRIEKEGQTPSGMVSAPFLSLLAWSFVQGYVRGRDDGHEAAHQHMEAALAGPAPKPKSTPKIN